MDSTTLDFTFPSLEKAKTNIKSVHPWIEEGCNLEYKYLDKEAVSIEQVQKASTKIKHLSEVLAFLASNNKRIGGIQDNITPLSEQLAKQNEVLTKHAATRQDPTARYKDRLFLLEKQIMVYEERLGFDLTQLKENNTFLLTLRHFSPDRKATGELTFTFHGNNYKFLDTNPSIPEDRLKKMEEHLNHTQNFQSFLCYLRKQFCNTCKTER